MDTREREGEREVLKEIQQQKSINFDVFSAICVQEQTLKWSLGFGSGMSTIQKICC